MCFPEHQNTCLRLLECSNRWRRQIFDFSFPFGPVQIILHFCDNIYFFYTIKYIYGPPGNQSRRGIISARHMLAIKFASIYNNMYALFAFELLPCLSWRVVFNLFSYSFTLCSLPVTPFSRFIFIAIYYPSQKERKKERKKGRVEREEKRVEMPSEKGGGEEILYRFPSFMFNRIKVDCLNAASRERLLCKSLC